MKLLNSSFEIWNNSGIYWNVIQPVSRAIVGLSGNTFQHKDKASYKTYIDFFLMLFSFLKGGPIYC